MKTLRQQAFDARTATQRAKFDLLSATTTDELIGRARKILGLELSPEMFNYTEQGRAFWEIPRYQWAITDGEDMLCLAVPEGSATVAGLLVIYNHHDETAPFRRIHSKEDLADVLTDIDNGAIWE